MQNDELEAFMKYLLIDYGALYLAGKMTNKYSRKYKFSILVKIIDKKVLFMEINDPSQDENEIKRLVQ